jgi:hypothetical protein
MGDVSMIGYKDREVLAGGKASVYFNLRQHVFSMKQGKHVTLHTPALYLTNVRFHINENGRQEVLRKKQKAVHAYVKGTFQAVHEGSIPADFREAYYNPYKVSTFVDKETGEPLLGTYTEAILVNKKVYYK